MVCGNVYLGDGNCVRHNVASVHPDASRASQSKQRHVTYMVHVERFKHDQFHVLSIGLVVQWNIRVQYMTFSGATQNSGCECVRNLV